ncbi:MAG: homoserine kinase, partial [Cellulophaga baltica]
EDYELIGRSLEDHIVEPIRSILIPGFDTVKQKALESGALGCGISGSGPSVFALSKGIETAKKVAQAMTDVYDKIGIDYDIHVSKVNTEGIKVL